MGSAFCALYRRGLRSDGQLTHSMRNVLRFSVLSALGLIACARSPRSSAISLSPASSVAPGDWLTYNRTLAGDRFSPLAEINRANVSQLRVVCRYALPEVTALQTGPLVIGGTIYFTTDTISYAIDGAPCAQKWKSVRHSPTPSRL